MNCIADLTMYSFAKTIIVLLVTSMVYSYPSGSSNHISYGRRSSTLHLDCSECTPILPLQTQQELYTPINPLKSYRSNTYTSQEDSIITEIGLDREPSDIKAEDCGENGCLVNKEITFNMLGLNNYGRSFTLSAGKDTTNISISIMLEEFNETVSTDYDYDFYRYEVYGISALSYSNVDGEMHWYCRDMNEPCFKEAENSYGIKLDVKKLYSGEWILAGIVGYNRVVGNGDCGAWKPFQTVYLRSINFIIVKPEQKAQIRRVNNDYWINSNVVVSLNEKMRYKIKIDSEDLQGKVISISENIDLVIEPYSHSTNTLRGVPVIKYDNDDIIYTTHNMPPLGAPPAEGFGTMQITRLDLAKVWTQSFMNKGSRGSFDGAGWMREYNPYTLFAKDRFEHSVQQIVECGTERETIRSFNTEVMSANSTKSIARYITDKLRTDKLEITSEIEKEIMPNDTSTIDTINAYRVNAKCCVRTKHPTIDYLEVTKKNFYKLNEYYGSKGYLGSTEGRSLSFDRLQVPTFNMKLNLKDVEVYYTTSEVVPAGYGIIEAVGFSNGGGSYIKYNVTGAERSGMCKLTTENILLKSDVIPVSARRTTVGTIPVRNIINPDKKTKICFGSSSMCEILDIKWKAPPTGGMDDEITGTGNGTRYYDDFWEYTTSNIWICVLNWFVIILDCILGIFFITTAFYFFKYLVTFTWNWGVKRILVGGILYLLTFGRVNMVTAVEWGDSQWLTKLTDGDAKYSVGVGPSLIVSNLPMSMSLINVTELMCIDTPVSVKGGKFTISTIRTTYNSTVEGNTTKVIVGSMLPWAGYVVRPVKSSLRLIDYDSTMKTGLYYSFQASRDFIKSNVLYVFEESQKLTDVAFIYRKSLMSITDGTVNIYTCYPNEIFPTSFYEYELNRIAGTNLASLTLIYQCGAFDLANKNRMEIESNEKITCEDIEDNGKPISNYMCYVILGCTTRRQIGRTLDHIGNRVMKDTNSPMRMRCADSRDYTSCITRNMNMVARMSNDGSVPKHTDFIKLHKEIKLYDSDEYDIGYFYTGLSPGRLEYSENGETYCKDGTCVVSYDKWRTHEIYKKGQTIKFYNKENVELEQYDGSGIIHYRLAKPRGCPKSSPSGTLECAEREFHDRYWGFYLSPLWILLIGIFMVVCINVYSNWKMKGVSGLVVATGRNMGRIRDNIRDGNINIFRGTTVGWKSAVRVKPNMAVDTVDISRMMVRRNQATRKSD